MPVKTLLILGAGASHGYGFPTGHKLREKILGLKSNLELFEFFAKTSKSRVREFLDSFEGSEVNTIDSYLATNPNLKELGKVAIGLVLHNCENKPITSPSDHWYRHLWNKLKTDRWEDLDLSWLKIITFNYDLSLEYYLFNSIQNLYGKTSTEALQKMTELEIHHVYGNLGPSVLDYAEIHIQIPLDEFDEDAVADRFIRSIAGIKVISEARDDTSRLEALKNLVQQSKRIGILGFGFDQTNLDRINSDDAFGSIANLKEVIATTVGFSERQVEEIKKKIFKQNLSIQEDKIFFENKNCLSLLSDHMLLD